MDIIILNNSDSPIYEQIKEQIKAQIVNGHLKAGDMLPSMRVLAKELRISIITTKRAYEELEREGYIESFTGKGSFVKTVNKEMLRENIMYEIENLLETAIIKARTAEMKYEELSEILKVLYEEGEENNNE
ncbi:MAG: GntR family transcriptional regulator [Butyrivibrio sp.]